MMKPLALDAILASLQRGQYAPCYFLQGEGSFAIDELVQHICRSVLPPAAWKLNLSVYYGKDVTLRLLLGHVRCLPILGARRVILVKEAQAMADLHHADGEQQLVHYLQHPNPQGVLVFIYRKRLVRASLRKAFSQPPHVLFTASKVHERALPAWIRRRASQAGCAIDAQALLLLQYLIGPDLHRLAKALDQLALRVTEGGEITEALVVQHVDLQRHFTTFELQRAIGARDVDKALRLALHFSRNVQQYPVIPLVGLLTHFFCKLLQLHCLSPATDQQQAEVLGVPRYFIGDYQRAMRQHTRDAVVRHLHVLHRADLQLKGIYTPTLKEGVVLKALVAQLLAGAL